MRKIRFFLCALTVLVLFAGQAVAASYQPDEKTQKTLGEAQTAYGAKDFAKTIKLIKPLAEKNNPVAAHLMGIMAARGEGQTRDFKAAETWFKKAADAGNPYATLDLGELYISGELGAQDLVKGRQYVTKAADMGHLGAVFLLGTMQKAGAGGAKDAGAAFKNFEKAAAVEGGNPLAEYELGNCYLYGEGVKKNLAKAKEYYKKAADKGMPAAKLVLDVIAAVGK